MGTSKLAPSTAMTSPHFPLCYLCKHDPCCAKGWVVCELVSHLGFHKQGISLAGGPR